MKKLLKYLVMSLFIIGLTNCSSSLFSLSPDEQSTFEMGRNVIEKETKVAYSTLSFEEQIEEEFIFHVFVYNKVQKGFLFDPSYIYVKNYDANKDHIGDKTYTIDPENDIDDLKAMKSYWKNDVLRKSAISREEGVDGIIYIPLNPEASFIKAFVPISETMHIYKFKQVAQ